MFCKCEHLSEEHATVDDASRYYDGQRPCMAMIGMDGDRPVYCSCENLTPVEEVPVFQNPKP